ncbi:MAG: hypothetical protein EOP48_02535 [Sphingobacteriales bacterium]|nr:MAG: hypothetical protein EOP48_02535 [Sphingobacteriales bacterium]
MISQETTGEVLCDFTRKYYKDQRLCEKSREMSGEDVTSQDLSRNHENFTNNRKARTDDLNPKERRGRSVFSYQDLISQLECKMKHENQNLLFLKITRHELLSNDK